MVVYPLNQKIEQFARKHTALSKSSLIALLTLTIPMWFGSFAFGGLLIEEMIDSCSGHQTLLQSLGLNLNGINKYCNNTEHHTYLTNSILEIAVCFGFGIQCWWLSGFSYQWIKKITNERPTSEVVN